MRRQLKVGALVGLLVLSLVGCRGSIADPAGDYTPSTGGAYFDLSEVGVDYTRETTALWMKFHSSGGSIGLQALTFNISTNDDTVPEFAWSNISPQSLRRLDGGGYVACAVTLQPDGVISFPSSCLGNGGALPAGLRVAGTAAAGTIPRDSLSHDETDYTSFILRSDPREDT